MFECGAIIDDRYEILSLIGEGGMSFVYLARDVHLGKLWAVKVIKRLGNPSHDAVVRTSFRAEAELMRSLDHPSLPRIVGIIEQDGLM